MVAYLPSKLILEGLHILNMTFKSTLGSYPTDIFQNSQRSVLFNSLQKTFIVVEMNYDDTTHTLEKHTACAWLVQKQFVFKNVLFISVIFVKPKIQSFSNTVMKNVTYDKKVDPSKRLGTKVQVMFKLEMRGVLRRIHTPKKKPEKRSVPITQAYFFAMP